MEGRHPNRRGESLTPRQKRVFVVVGVALVVLLGGFGAWAAASSGRYGGSGHGCINVVVPSSTGGGILHDCGAAARTLCRQAFTAHTQLARYARPQCRLAGLGRPG
ncbi:MAG TPA: hypothetical protein VIX86_12455 [Streptosporangiaceae bacterium]